MNITVLLKMGMLINGRGTAKDISPSGMRLVSPQVFRSMSCVQAKDFEGSLLRVMLPAEGITVHGI
ncbi:MAG TPA: hypothetical protein PLW83_06755, partial [Deltaproteobacteria bacterium]|nr:hypothetical protein [Deltaproteobacteria bacterium]